MTLETLSPLPAPPAAELHILPPASLVLLLVVLALLLLSMAWLVLRGLFRRRPAPAAASSPAAPRPVPAAAAISIGARIRAIERKFLESKAFREGCHALAALAKVYLGQRTGEPVERMTSLEIAIAIEDERIGRFMTALSRRRYGREEPRRRHFIAACAEARELLA